MVNVDFLSTTGTVVSTMRCELTFEEALDAAERRDWSATKHIRAIRVRDSYRSAIRRRPVDAYGPGSLPHIGA